MDINKANTTGTFVALFILFICSLIFISRLSGQTKIEYWLGIILIFTSLPLIYLIFTAKQFHRPAIYYIQIGTMLGFLIAELALDYFFKVDFRNIRWMAIGYVMLFFAGTGGMIGVAAQSGKLYSIIAIILFFIMAFLAFFQRIKTGM
jgi:hypothetical protein